MKRIKLIVVISLIISVLGGVMFFIENKEDDIKIYEFEANIEQINELNLLVSPLYITDEYKSSDLIYVVINDDINIEEFVIGEKVLIKYDGVISESYPAQINNVYEINKVEK